MFLAVLKMSIDIVHFYVLKPFSLQMARKAQQLSASSMNSWITFSNVLTLFTAFIHLCQVNYYELLVYRMSCNTFCIFVLVTNRIKTSCDPNCNMDIIVSGLVKSRTSLNTVSHCLPKSRQACRTGAYYSQSHFFSGIHGQWVLWDIFYSLLHKSKQAKPSLCSWIQGHFHTC